MKFPYNKQLIPRAKKLRKNMTPEEKHLWYDFLKKLPITVNRQKTLGNFIVDFYIDSAHLVIEIDGIQHEMQENSTQDKKRDEILANSGICVLRYTNQDINHNFYEVCQDILSHLDIPPSSINIGR